MIRRSDYRCTTVSNSSNITGGVVCALVLFVVFNLERANADEFLEVSKSWTVVSVETINTTKSDVLNSNEDLDSALSEGGLEWEVEVQPQTNLLKINSESKSEPEPTGNAEAIVQMYGFDEVSADWDATVVERRTQDLSADVSTMPVEIQPTPIPDTEALRDEGIQTELPFSFDPIGSESVSVVATPDTGGFVIDDSVPAGFEALAGPQTKFVDIYYNERKAGSTTITGTDETFVFDKPEDVLSMLHGISKPNELALLLTENFASNAHLICYSANDPVGCGQVEANPIATLYNPSELKVELFLSQEFQDVLSRDQIMYLPAAESRNSAIASFNGVATDLYGQESTLDFSSRALVGYGNGHLAAELDYNTRSRRKRLRELKLAHFFKKHELALGTYAYQAGGGLSDFSLFGASFSSTLKTRIDLEHAFSSELVVFLTRRSVVQLVVREQIYSGESYAAGNQVLDTRALPEGSYEVEIRILDPVAGERTEIRVFTKSTQIPPRGEWIYNATVGVPVIFNDENVYPELTDAAVVGASVARRINDASASKFGGLQLGRRSFLQTEYLYLGREFSFQAAATIGEDQTRATSFLGNYVKYRINAGVSLETFESNAEESSDSEFADVFRDNYQQLGVSLGKSFETYYLGLRSSVRKQNIDGEDFSSNQYALNYRRPLFNKKSVRGYLDASIQKDDIERQVLLQLKVFFKRKQWLHALTGELNNGEVRGNRHRYGVETHWQSKDLRAYQVDVGAYASRADDSNTTGIDLDVQHALFSAGLSSDWNQLSNGSYQQNKIASLSSHIGMDGRGFAIGGTDFAQAGVIVSVTGEPAGESFDILVNGAKTSVGRIGTSQFIGLQPFETYRIKMVPNTILSNGLGGDIYEFTLYPGNVQRIDIVTEQKVLLIANLIDESGLLLEEGVVEVQPNPQLLSVGGFLQAEVSPGKVLLVRRGDGSACEFVVPDGENDAVLIMDEPLLCRTVGASHQAK